MERRKRSQTITNTELMEPRKKSAPTFDDSSQSAVIKQTSQEQKLIPTIEFTDMGINQEKKFFNSSLKPNTSPIPFCSTKMESSPENKTVRNKSCVSLPESTVFNGYDDIRLRNPFSCLQKSAVVKNSFTLLENLSWNDNTLKMSYSPQKNLKAITTSEPLNDEMAPVNFIFGEKIVDNEDDEDDEDEGLGSLDDYDIDDILPVTLSQDNEYQKNKKMLNFKRSDEETIRLEKRSQSDKQSVNNTTTLLNLLKPRCEDPVTKNDTELENFSTVLENSGHEPKATRDIKNIKEKSYVCVASSQLPYDWSLKNLLSITSLNSLSWCTSGSTSIEATGALIDFVGLSPVADLANINPSLRELKQREFQRCLYHWTYPAVQPSPFYVTMITNLLSKNNVNKLDEENELKYFRNLEEEWELSFQSLYQLLRRRICAYFYYIGPSFTVLFLAKDTAGKDEIKAIINRSTIGLRKALVHEEIQFDMPFERQKATTLQKGDEGNSTSKTSQQPFVNFSYLSKEHRNFDNSKDSLLYFQGSLSVHGLFNFLLNLRENRVELRAKGPPQLISPVAFSNASLKCAKIIKTGMIRQTVTNQKSHDSAIENFYRLDIAGIILPSSFNALLKLLNVAHEGDYSIACKIDERTVGVTYGLSESNNVYEIAGNEQNVVERKEIRYVEKSNKGFTYK